MIPFKTPAVVLGQDMLDHESHVLCGWCGGGVLSGDCRYWQQYEEGKIVFFCDCMCSMHYQ